MRRLLSLWLCVAGAWASAVPARLDLSGANFYEMLSVKGENNTTNAERRKDIIEDNLKRLIHSDAEHADEFRLELHQLGSMWGVLAAGRRCGLYDAFLEATKGVPFNGSVITLGLLKSLAAREPFHSAFFFSSENSAFEIPGTREGGLSLGEIHLWIFGLYFSEHDWKVYRNPDAGAKTVAEHMTQFSVFLEAHFPGLLAPGFPLLKRLREASNLVPAPWYDRLGPMSGIAANLSMAAGGIAVSCAIALSFTPWGKQLVFGSPVGAEQRLENHLENTDASPSLEELRRRRVESATKEWADEAPPDLFEP